MGDELSSWAYRSHDDLFDLLSIDLEEVLSLRVDKPGAYALASAKSDWTFRYPGGLSRVYYIGRAGSRRDRRRLITHWDQVFWTKERNPNGPKHRGRPWTRAHQREPIYAYGAEFGASVMWWDARTSQTANQLEARLMEDFHTHYGVLPVANRRRESKRPQRASV